jgi:Leucine-rich repeat (LRR) protein
MSKKPVPSVALSLNRLNEEDERDVAGGGDHQALTESGPLENIDELGEIQMNAALNMTQELAMEQEKLRESINTVFKAVPLCEPPLFSVLIDNDAKRIEYLEQVLVNRLVYNDLINEMRSEKAAADKDRTDQPQSQSVAEYASYLSTVFNTTNLLNEITTTHNYKSSQPAGDEFLEMAERCLFLSNLYLNNESLNKFKIEDIMADATTEETNTDRNQKVLTTYSPEERFNFSSNIKRITFVCLTKNNLKQLPVSLVSIFQNLEIIDLSENQFESIDLVNLCCFSKLKEVNLSSNLLKHFKPTLISNEDEKREQFFLTRQAISSSSSNSIQEADSSGETSEFKQHLSHLAKSLFVSVERLNLSNNSLVSVNSALVSQFKNLKYLNLSNNNYEINSETQLPWQIMSNQLHNLVELNLSKNNKASDIASKEPNTNENRISPLSARVGGSVVRRDSAYSLNSSRMSTASTHVIKTFNCLVNLRVLNLSENNLKNMPRDIRDLKHLEHLDLSKNNMEFLPTELASLKSLKVLLLR